MGIQIGEGVSLRRALGLDPFLPDAVLIPQKKIGEHLPTRPEESVAFVVDHAKFESFEVRLRFERGEWVELRLVGVSRAPGFPEAGLVERMLKAGFSYLFDNFPDLVVTLEAARSDEMIGYSYWPEKLRVVNVLPLLEFYDSSTPPEILDQVKALPPYLRDFTPEHFKIWRDLGVTFEGRLTKSDFFSLLTRPPF